MGEEKKKEIIIPGRDRFFFFSCKFRSGDRSPRVKHGSTPPPRSSTQLPGCPRASLLRPQSGGTRRQGRAAAALQTDPPHPGRSNRASRESAGWSSIAPRPRLTRSRTRVRVRGEGCRTRPAPSPPLHPQTRPEENSYRWAHR